MRCWLFIFIALQTALLGGCAAGPKIFSTSATPVAHSYDARNRLTGVAASGSAPALTYGYDSEAHRTSITCSGQTTNFVVDPTGLSKVLVRIDPHGNHTYYVYGNGLLYQLDDAGNMVTYHYDSRGSTVALTDGTGAVTDRAEYSAYGSLTKRTGTTDTPFLYNGRYGVMTDPNGLYYMRARYYNPYLKRFLNADPAGLSAGLNFYAYADGNPISNLDPLGLAALGEMGNPDSRVLIDQYFSQQQVTVDDLVNGLLGLVDSVLSLPWNTAYGMASSINTMISGQDDAGNYVSGWSRAWATAQVALTVVPLVGELSDGLVAVNSVDTGIAAEGALTTPGSVPLGFTRVELQEGSFLNRVYDSSGAPGTSRLFGQSFSPGSGLPTDAASAITSRGLNPAINNAQLGGVFRVNQSITVYQGTALGGNAPELFIPSGLHQYITPVLQNVPIVPVAP